MRPSISQFIPFVLLSAFFLTGCGSFNYYLDILNGHAEILNKAEPISEILQRQDIRPAVKQALRELQQARQFAVAELYLPDNGSYREYADIGRRYVVWNVVATDEFSLQPQQWCFLIVGCLSYRGFYSRTTAEEFAAALHKQGKDVYVAGVKAYSTLGWFDDPLLNTMLYRDLSMRMNLLFHELAHQKIYVAGDTAFNEAFATAVAQEGVRRWLIKQGKAADYERYLQKLKYRQAFNHLLRQARQDLEKIYTADLGVAEMRQRKRLRFARLQQEYQQLKARWGNDTRFDGWMAQDLNNAHLLLVATYHDAVPGFQAMLAQHGGDLQGFYREVEGMLALSKEARHRRLDKLARGGVAAPLAGYQGK